MKQLIMTPRELIYLAAQTQAQQFFGLADPFWSMTREELRAAIPEIQSSLVHRGLADMDFNGIFLPRSDVMDLITCCAECSRHLAVDMVEQGVFHKLFAYKGAQAASLLRPVSAEQVSLESADIAMLKKQLTELPGWFTGATASGEPQTVTFSTLAKAQQAKTSTETRKLLTVGDNTAQIIMDGFSGVGNYYAFTLSDFMSRDVASFLCLNSPTGSLRMIRASLEDQDAWTFAPISWDDARDSILTLVDKLMYAEGDAADAFV